MTGSLLVLQGLAGLANAMVLFLVAAGLSLIFGVSRIVNFAHGSFYMLAAYLTYTVTRLLPAAPWHFWLALVLVPLVIAGLGGIIEVTLLRRIYRAPEISQLLLTFALVLIAEDAVRYLWGVSNKTVAMPTGLAGAVSVLGHSFPAYTLWVIALGPIVLLGLWLLLAHTRWGILVRAATENRDMVAVLGEDQARLFTGIFVLGSWLAGVGGTLAAPLVALTPGMDTTMIVEAFAVVVIGGMGSVAGSLLAALLIGELQAFGVLLLPRLTLMLVFVVMAGVLVVRPWGLAGRPLPPKPVASGAAAPAPGRGRLVRLGWGLVGVGLLLVPALVGPFGLVVAVEMLAFAVCACSLNVLLGYGGMLSFGHAAYVGLGAYGAALLLTRAQCPGLLAGALGPLVAAGGALVFGVFCVRLRGIYFAMLTLACAQVAYTVVFQWYSVTGGDNGILGIWPAPWLATPMAYYYCTLAVTGAAVWSLRTILGSPFGLALRAIRDNPRRAMTLGLHVPVQQLAAFVLAGFFAGVAGVVLVFQQGSVFPEALSVVQSLDILVMVLLGGMQSFAGPLLGAGLYKLLDTVVTTHVEYWSAVLGVILGALVLLAPEGVLGFMTQCRERWRRPHGR